MCDIYMDEEGIPMHMTMSKESFHLSSKIQETIIHNWCYNVGFLYVRLNTILIWYIGPMAFSWNATYSWLMICWIWYIAMWNRWLRVRVSVVQVCCINHKGISKHCWGLWTLSPMQPGSHKGHNLFRSLEWTHQCARVWWHPGSLTKYCMDQTL